MWHILPFLLFEDYPPTDDNIKDISSMNNYWSTDKPSSSFSKTFIFKIHDKLVNFDCTFGLPATVPVIFFRICIAKALLLLLLNYNSNVKESKPVMYFLCFCCSSLNWVVTAILMWYN